MRWATVLVLLPVQNLRHGSWDYNISWQLLRRSWGSGRSEDVAMLQEDEEWCSGHSRMWNIFCEYKGQFIQRIILKIFSFAAMLLMFQAGSLFLQLCCTANGSSWSLARGIATVVPCCRTTISASNLKFGAVLCGPWTCLRLHCIFFLVEGFELLSRLFFFPTEDHTQPNGPFFYFLDNGGEVDSYTP